MICSTVSSFLVSNQTKSSDLVSKLQYQLRSSYPIMGNKGKSGGWSLTSNLMWEHAFVSELIGWIKCVSQWGIGSIY